MENKEFTCNVCVKCTKLQDSCCVDSPVPVTISDIEKIQSLGYKLEDFVEAWKYSEDFFEEDDDYWWKDSIIKYKGGLFKCGTKKTSDLKCVFLKEGKGCVLGDDRPAVCHFFPFWYDCRKKKITLSTLSDPFCYAVREIKDMKKLIESMDETEESVIYYFKEFKNDCLKNKKKHRKIFMDLIKNNKK